jgi:dTMP kinase
MNVPGPHGVLVVIEGIDGGGKTTLRAALADRCRDAGREVVQTKEPTDGPLGRRIRAVAASGRAGISAEEELALFHEDRRQHVAELVRPALARGAVVLQDRSYFSTVAYQGERGLDRARLLAESEAIAPRPDLLLVLDLPPELALERIRRSRDGGTDDFERVENLSRVRQAFLAFPDALVLDARLPPEALAEQAWAALAPRLTAAASDGAPS